jgi:hypothetical protein
MTNRSKLAKAESVTKQGEADGYVPPSAYCARVLRGGYTRLDISTPMDKLAIIHRELVKTIQFPCKIRYVRMTDRQSGQLEKPESYVAVEISKDRMLQALQSFEELFYNDGRNQLWIQGASEEQIVLDELGMLYVYPDDFVFRDTLTMLGWPEMKHESMAQRDYVKVNFSVVADEQERSLITSFGLVRWEG